MSNDRNKAPLLSVIVPVCNVERYLEECLSSIQDQDIDDIEVICINDGSTDSSLEILKTYASDDERFAIIDKANAGYGAAVNDGIDAATGEFLCILESDDYVTRDGWSKLIRLCQDNALDLAKGCYYRHSDDDVFFRVYENTDRHCPPWLAKIPANEVFNPVDSLRVFWMTPSIWSSVFRRSFLIENNIRCNETPGASYQDAGFFFQVWSSAKRALISDEPIIHYRIDNMGSSSNSKKKVYCVCDEMDFIKNRLLFKDVDIIFWQVFCAIRYKTYRWNINRIADEYVAEFETRMARDLYSDFEDGIFSPLFFKQKDINDFMSRIMSLSSPIDETTSSENDRWIDGNFQLYYGSSPLVSVIVEPSEDAGKLSRCLSSIKAQSYKKIEVICMMHDTNDERSKTITEFCNKDSRFSRFSSSSFDESIFRDAVNLSHGQYLLFVKPSSEFTKLAIKRISGYAYLNHVDIVIYDSKQTFEHKAFMKGCIYDHEEGIAIAESLAPNSNFNMVFDKDRKISSQIPSIEFAKWDYLHSEKARTYFPQPLFSGGIRAIIANDKYAFVKCSDKAISNSKDPNHSEYSRNSGSKPLSKSKKILKALRHLFGK